MRRLAVLNLGSDRFRWGPWRGDDRLAYLVPVPVPGRPLSAQGITNALEVIKGGGYSGVLTAALGHNELAPFSAAGFSTHERLHLLRHPLDRLPAPKPRRGPIRRAGRQDRTEVLSVDSSAFDPFWRFDQLGIDEARRATPHTRFRVHASLPSGLASTLPTAGPMIAGYAITGRSLDLSYLQRLAVRPEAQRQGIGRALVIDALHWARRRSATAMLVNTQEINRRALALYESLGFELEEQGLTVLWRSFEPATVDAGRPTIAPPQ